MTLLHIGDTCPVPIEPESTRVQPSSAAAARTAPSAPFGVRRTRTGQPARRREHQLVGDLLPVEAEHVQQPQRALQRRPWSTEPSRRSTAPRPGTPGRPRRAPLPAPRRQPRRGPRGRRRLPRRRHRRSRSIGTSAAQQCTTVAASPAAREDPLQRVLRQRRCDRAVPVEARGGRHLAGQDERQRRLVELEDQRGAGHASLHVREVEADPLGQRLRQLTAGAEVGEHLVAARLLDGRGERPWSGDLDLELTAVALELLLEHVEVLGQQRTCPAVVDTRGVGEPPAGGLEVEPELADDGDATTGQVGDRPARRAARAGAAGPAARRRPGARPRRSPHRASSRCRWLRSRAGSLRCASAASRRVAEIVAEPTTREPSYTTTAWPGAIPAAGSSRSTRHGVLVGRHDRSVLLAVGAELHRALQRHPGRGSGAAPARPDRRRARRRSAPSADRRSRSRRPARCRARSAGCPSAAGVPMPQALALADRVAPASPRAHRAPRRRRRRWARHG